MKSPLRFLTLLTGLVSLLSLSACSGNSDKATGDAHQFLADNANQAASSRAVLVHLPASGCTHCRGTALTTIQSMTAKLASPLFVLVSGDEQSEIDALVADNNLGNYSHLITAQSSELEEYDIAVPFYPTIYHIEDGQVVERQTTKPESVEQKLHSAGQFLASAASSK